LDARDRVMALVRGPAPGKGRGGVKAVILSELYNYYSRQ